MSPARTRRRGAALAEALYAATLSELAERGYRGLSIEGVAARAGTGKAAMYRRWPGKLELVLDALAHAAPEPPDPGPRSLPAREALLGMFRAMCGVFAEESPLPTISLVADLLREPALRARFTGTVVGPRLQAVQAILTRGIEQGELDPDALGPLAAQTGPALILQTVLHTGRSPTDTDLEQVVDTVLAGAERRRVDATPPSREGRDEDA